MKFIIYNDAGEILSAGECPDDEIENQRRAGAHLIIGSADPSKDAVDVASGRVIPGGRMAPAETPDDYRAARAMAYPPIEEQLDMLWSAMDANPARRLEPFYSRIKAVKDAYPKGSKPSGGAIIYGVEGQ